MDQQDQGNVTVVYVVMSDHVYEGDEVYGVFKNKADADAYARELLKKDEDVCIIARNLR